MGGNKTCLIVINGNINTQTYINDVLAVEALPFSQFQWSKYHLYPLKQVCNELGRRVRRNHSIHAVNDLAAALQTE